MRDFYSGKTIQIIYSFLPGGKRAYFIIPFFLFISFLHLSAQPVDSYVFSSAVGTYTPLSAPVNITPSLIACSTFSNLDEGTVRVNLPFDFNFGNSVFTVAAGSYVSVSTNGYLGFSTSAQNLDVSCPSPGTNYDEINSNNNTISAFAIDMICNSTGGSISYQTQGNSPNRTFTIQWANFYRGVDAPKWTDNLNFQVILHETTNVVQVVYGAMNTGTLATGSGGNGNSSISIGLRGAGTDFNSRKDGTTVTDWNATGPALANTNASANQKTYKNPANGTSPNFPVSGETFTWTPPALCTGAPLVTSVSSSPVSVCAATTGTPAGASLSFSGLTAASGYAYQWQQSATTSGFTDIAGATNFTYATGSTLPSSPTYYVCNVKCTASGQSTPSNPLPVSYNSFLNCYCKPTFSPGSGGGTDAITNVSLPADVNSINNNVGTIASPYFSVITTPVTGMTVGSTYTISIKGGTIATTAFSVWIDFNGDGSFNSTANGNSASSGGEWIGSIPSGDYRTIPGTLTFTVLSNAVLGTTVALRVIQQRSTAPSASQSCGAIVRGEGVDFYVNFSLPKCSGVPQAGTVTPTVPAVCPGATSIINLSGQSTGVTGITYQWQVWDGSSYINVSDGSGANTAGYTTGSIANATQGDISALYNCVVGCSNSGQSSTQASPASITIHPSPSLSVAPPAPAMCNGSDAWLTASNAVAETTSYSWSPSLSLNTSTGPHVEATPAGSATYTVTAIDVNNCTGSMAATVTVLPLPVITVNPSSAICTGASHIALTASGGPDGYTWFPNSLLNTSTGGSVIAQLTGLTYYTVTGMGANGCTANSAPVPVGGTPSGGISLPVLSVICNGGTENLSTTGAAGSSYQWQISADNINWTSIIGATNVSYTTQSGDADSKKYYRLVSQSSACWNVASTTATVDVSATPAVTITNVTSKSVIVNWTPYASGQYNITWSGPAGSGSAIAVTTNQYQVTGLADNKDLTVTVVPANPACTGVNTRSADTHTLCAAPGITNLVATTFHGFTASWTAVNGAGSYRLYYRDLTTSASWSFMDVNATTATVTVLYGSHTYAVWVAAKDCPATGVIGEGSAPILYVTTKPSSTCTQVPTVTAESDCPNQLTINLSGSSGPYAVTLRRISPGITSGVTYTVSGPLVNVTVGTQYAGTVWEIFAKTSCGGGNYSDISNVAVVTVKPGCNTLTNLVLSHPTCNGFTASWNADNCSGAGISNYQLMVKKSTATGYNGYPVSAANNFIIIGFLLPNTTYNVVVVSVSCNGATSAYSGVQTITTSACREEEENQLITNISDNGDAVSVYPNPTEGSFWMNLSRKNNKEATMKVELINQLGQVIQTNISQVTGEKISQVVNIPVEVAAGIYFIRTSIEGNVYVNRLMISNEQGLF